MQAMSPMRGACNVITVGTGDYKKLVNIHGTGSGWVDEDDTRTATNTPQLAQVAAVMGEIYANPQATQTALDDIFFDAEGWLSQEIAEAFAIAEGTAFVTGNGTKKPKGFLAYTTSSDADSARAFGTVQYIATGSDGAFKTATASVNQADDLITAIQAMKSGLRTGAAWMLNSATLATVRKWKAYSTGDYIWQPGLQAGAPSSLLGYPVVENEDMPDVGSGTVPIALANWKRAYTIVDRIGIRTLRDPYTNKPYVGFYATKRVGGMLVDSNAIKLIKLSAS
jgi:HK97 family phage major capsid protein